MAETLENIQEMVLILNRERQIVFANRRFLEFRGDDNAALVFGLRPGEAVECIHALADDTPAGCGTSEFCETCGAVNAILESQRTGLDIQECSIVREKDADALNLRVRATTFKLGSEPFTLFAIQDISDEKRRGELERLFFHDILNTAGAIRGLADVFEMAPPEKQNEFRHRISVGTSRLIDEINSHRVIAAAEHDELSCSPTQVESLEFLREILFLFDGHASTANRTLAVSESAVDFEFETDRGLLSRVVVNMVRNALEATEPGGTVSVGADHSVDEVRFWVHNSSVMTRDVAVQVFNRSFSTKGKGRGLGTYSMRLIGERYLKGQVSFVSTEKAGTTFEAVFPRKFS
ncbi:MAG: HAMP domain-containing histidine kinase [Rhodospirillales bacterium]|nr:HAMP domain-containing histidine kinase [Rhodospirillales bacterium]